MAEQIEHLWDMRRALAAAKEVQENGNKVADAAADLCVGRLRYVDAATLADMKRELRDFNMTTHRWNDDD